MSNELQTASEAIWTAVKSKIDTAMTAGGSLVSVKEFLPNRRHRVGKLKTYALVVLERSIVPSDWGANRGTAEQTVLFGLTGTTYQPETSADDLQTLVFALMDLFLQDPALAGAARDVRVDSIAPDAPTPEGVEESTQPWATLQVTWDFEFLRP
ncbi:MAG: hypothetical protein HY678_12635 [Chloroflexi bacterium]|nr:hypothetical protein [Chloroflexota bacterium]